MNFQIEAYVLFSKSCTSSNRSIQSFDIVNDAITNHLTKHYIKKKQHKTRNYNEVLNYKP